MRSYSRFFLLLAFLTWHCFCGPIATVPLSALLNQADSVVVATVTQSENTADSLALRLEVLRRIKGQEKAGHDIQAVWSSSAPTANERAKNLLTKTGIWFLKQSDSTWNILPLVMGDIQPMDLYIRVPPGDLPTMYAYGSEAQPNVRLVKEIEAAAVNPLTSYTAARTVKDLDNGLGSTLVQGVFSSFSQSSSLPMKVAGVNGQLRNSTPQAAAALLSLAPDTLSVDTQNQLSREMCGYRSTDPSAIATLSIFLGAQYSPAMRFCAAHALREIHTAKTMPVLASLFNDPVSRIRYDAVIGVAQYAMGFPVASAEDKHTVVSNYRPGPEVTQEMREHFPTEPKFEENEQEYISYWTKWLATQGVQ